MPEYNGNQLVSQSVILLNTRKKVAIDGHDNEEQISMANAILQTPVSIKQPLGVVSNLDDKEANEYIVEGARHLVTLHGYSDCSESALKLLQQYIMAQYNKLTLQYKISESRRKEKLETAFKSSAQHILCSNSITEPVMLQKYMHRKIYPHCLEIVEWWTKYIANPGDRAKLLKEFNPCDNGEDKNQPVPEEPKRGKKRKRAVEATVAHAISPPTLPASTNTIIPPWLTENEDAVTLNTSSESSLMTVDCVSGSETAEEKRTASTLIEEKASKLESTVDSVDKAPAVAPKQQRKPRKTTKQTNSRIPEEFWERMENAVEGSDHRSMAKTKPKRRPRK